MLILLKNSETVHILKYFHHLSPIKPYKNEIWNEQSFTATVSKICKSSESGPGHVEKCDGRICMFRS